ncbi:SOS response-associated peptidase family protein [Novosphingobium sp. PS1R-30]|uniref:Abasic site processing protein n=1 Tax=Novosphingobium anseongense TaxID=3133436 RepID=A0ABU8S0T2_9SPHN
MCNLSTVRKSAAEVAAYFSVAPPDIAAFNAAEETYPGYPGMVIREVEGRRRLETMIWGFPYRPPTMKPESKPQKVNNARGDKLNTSFWRDSFAKRRCLIPLTGWAEAEGPKGQMTRTWCSIEGTDIFAVGGIWRDTAEWGQAYSMVMVEASPQMLSVHTRMPVLLRPDEYDQWMHGLPEEAFGLVRTSHADLRFDRTPEPWTKRSTANATATLL